MSEMPKKSLSLLYCIADFVGRLRNSQVLGGIYTVAENTAKSLSSIFRAFRIISYAVCNVACSLLL